MEMFLILVMVSVLVGGVSAVLLLAAERANAPSPRPAERRPETRQVVVPSQFFASDHLRPADDWPAIPIELLVSQINGHVRLEHAAMEAFLLSPNAQSLHSRTTSTLVN
jgi:hypothetical protein